MKQIKAVIFDFDNTLMDFMRMKKAAVESAVDAMIDAGLTIKKTDMIAKVYKVYDREGIEDQQIFNKVLQDEMGRAELMRALGLKDEKHFREHYQQTAMNQGLIEMTIPDKPRSRSQKYRLTDLGKQILVHKE